MWKSKETFSVFILYVDDKEIKKNVKPSEGVRPNRACISIFK